MFAGSVYLLALLVIQLLIPRIGGHGAPRRGVASLAVPYVGGGDA